MDARSLVGASMSARKRAAREVSRAQQAPRGGSVVATIWRLLDGRPATAENLRAIKPLLPPWLNGVDEADIERLSRSRLLQPRSFWRIGERLRPCRGCEECIGYDVEMGLSHCDGSGVLPAKRSPIVKGVA